MWKTARVAVVVPAFREARLIGRTLRSMPRFVDAIYVVDDASDDGTSEAARAVNDARVRVMRHAVNAGVGAAIVSGYHAALRDGADVMAVMAGDNQMHPEDLQQVVSLVASGNADYVKGNRFVHAEARRMPFARRVAGKALSLATRLATDLDVDDCQCGFTALSANAARRLPLSELWPRFGYPNDLLCMISGRGLKVREVPVRPIYADEVSGVRPWHALTVGYVIARRVWLQKRGAHSAISSPVVSGGNRSVDHALRETQRMLEVETLVELGGTQTRSDLAVGAE